MHHRRQHGKDEFTYAHSSAIRPFVYRCMIAGARERRRPSTNLSTSSIVGEQPLIIDGLLYQLRARVLLCCPARTVFDTPSACRGEGFLKTKLQNCASGLFLSETLHPRTTRSGVKRSSSCADLACAFEPERARPVLRVFEKKRQRTDTLVRQLQIKTYTHAQFRIISLRSPLIAQRGVLTPLISRSAVGLAIFIRVLCISTEKVET